MKKEKQIGTVTHWYDKIGVAVVNVSGTLTKGDKIKVKKGENEFEEVVSSIQLNHTDVTSVKKGDDAAIKLSQHVKEGAHVFLVD